MKFKQIQKPFIYKTTQELADYVKSIYGKSKSEEVETTDTITAFVDCRNAPEGVRSFPTYRTN